MSWAATSAANSRSPRCAPSASGGGGELKVSVGSLFGECNMLLWAYLKTVALEAGRLPDLYAEAAQSPRLTGVGVGIADGLAQEIYIVRKAVAHAMEAEVTWRAAAIKSHLDANGSFYWGMDERWRLEQAFVEVMCSQWGEDKLKRAIFALLSSATEQLEIGASLHGWASSRTALDPSGKVPACRRSQWQSYVRHEVHQGRRGAPHCGNAWRAE